MEQIREFVRLGIALGVGKQRPGFEESDPRVPFHGRSVKFIHLFYFFMRAFLGFRAGKNLTKHDGHLLLLQLFDDTP